MISGIMPRKPNLSAILSLEIADADQPLAWTATVENRLEMSGRLNHSRSDFDAFRPN